MNYSQFLNMIPEATLVLALVIVFFADFALHKSERKTFVLGVLTGALLLCQIVPCFMAVLGDLQSPSSAFGGLYVTTPIVNVMKTILTLGTFIVVVMSQPWLVAHASQRESNDGQIVNCKFVNRKYHYELQSILKYDSRGNLSVSPDYRVLRRLRFA